MQFSYQVFKYLSKLMNEKVRIARFQLSEAPVLHLINSCLQIFLNIHTCHNQYMKVRISNSGMCKEISDFL